MLRIAFLLAAACVLMHSAVLASEKATTIPVNGGSDKIVVPANSLVEFASVSKEDYAAKFNGRFVLSGTYYYGDELPADDPDVDLEIDFVPDADIAAKLPYFQNYGRPKAIAFDNSAEIVKAIVPAEAIAKLNKKGAPFLRGRIAIIVDGYRADIVCDAPIFTVHFISVYKAPTRVAANEPNIGGCL